MSGKKGYCLGNRNIVHSGNGWHAPKDGGKAMCGRSDVHGAHVLDKPSKV